MPPFTGRIQVESEVEKRLKALEKDSHPPVQDWDDLEERIAKLEKQAEPSGNELEAWIKRSN